jgi:hypothetical protein
VLGFLDWIGIAIAALVPLFIVGWLVYALAKWKHSVRTAIKAVVSLLVWVVVSAAMFNVWLAVTFHGGATVTLRSIERTPQGGNVLIIAVLVYMAIGCGLALWVRGKPRPPNV